ncbi:unnamed protein product [Miscanthus lutarioriparius]|uniref:Uncharacterized protein n=1 Tax=Miscanthus lutarioriparius TaxID=422564 RepID=A0A811SBG2_9POAL|nr:unnamed protein product [Miscanthus lutarioriparius]
MSLNNDLGGAEEDLEECGGKDVKAVLEVEAEAEGSIVESVAEAGEERHHRGEEGVGGGDVPRVDGSAEGGHDGREERLPPGWEIGGRGGGEGPGELRLDEGRGGAVRRSWRRCALMMAQSEAGRWSSAGLGHRRRSRFLKWTEAARRGWRSWRGEAAKPRNASAKPGEEAEEEMLCSAARRAAASRESDCAN